MKLVNLVNFVAVVLKSNENITLPTIHKLSSHMNSIILPLPDDFVSYILKDGIVLPKHCTSQCILQTNDTDSDEEKDTWDDTEELEELEAPQFLDFDKNIKDAIKTLGGKVFPKLNWSSPQDASWITFNNSCCCTTVSDIYLLLKSSDFIVHDLTQRFMLCEDFVNDVESTNSKPKQGSETFYLVLRKWTDIDTSCEFRCFVKNGKLIGISQREHSLYFDHICLYKNEIVEDLTSFFNNHIHLKFPCDSYIFDVYRKKKGCVYLIDFNPFGIVTDSLLFRWDEFNEGSVTLDDHGLPEFRYVADNHGVQPRSLSYHALPKDIVDISTGEDSFKLVDLIKLKIDAQNDATDHESDDEKWEL